MPKMPINPEWLRVNLKGQAGPVDREKAVISGVILAEEGIFKDRRGEFDRQAIRKIVKLGNERSGGLKARWTHPNLSSDGLGRFLGRHKNLRSDTVLREAGKDASGKQLMKEVLVARADLHLDKTALEEPVGGGKPLGTYLMDLAESDSDAMGLSLVLKTEQTLRTDSKGRALKDEKTGEELPPLWMPTELHAADAVDDGDATHSFLSADILAGLPDAIVRQGCELLDKQFGGQERDAVKARLTAFVDRYLNLRFPVELAATDMPDDEIDIGDRVKVKAGKAHDEETADKEGKVVEIGTNALGIKFDGMEEVHHWYVAEELDLVQEEDDQPTQQSMSAKPVDEPTPEPDTTDADLDLEMQIAGVK